MAGVHLLNIAVQGAQVLLPGGEVLLGPEHHRSHDEEAQCRDGNGCQRHTPLSAKHHHQTAEELGHCADHGGQAVGQGLLQSTYVVGDAAEDVTIRHLAEVAHGHPVDFSGQVLPHIPGQLQGDRSHDEVLHIGKDGTEAVDHQQDYAGAADGGQIDLPVQGVGDEVRDPTEQAGADDGQHCAGHGEAKGRNRGRFQFVGIGEQFSEHTADAAPALSRRAHSVLHHLWHLGFLLKPPALPGRAGTGRSPGRSGRFASVPRGYPSPPSSPRPER